MWSRLKNIFQQNLWSGDIVENGSYDPMSKCSDWLPRDNNVKQFEFDTRFLTQHLVIFNLSLLIFVKRTHIEQITLDDNDWLNILTVSWINKDEYTLFSAIISIMNNNLNCVNIFFKSLLKKEKLKYNHGVPTVVWN